MELLTILTIVVATLAFPASLIMLLFRRRRRAGAWAAAASLIAWLIAVTLFGMQIGKKHQQEAAQAGFASYEDLKLAREAGLSDPSAFYADVAAIRARAEQRMREREAHERAAGVPMQGSADTTLLNTNLTKHEQAAAVVTGVALFAVTCPGYDINPRAVAAHYARMGVDIDRVSRNPEFVAFGTRWIKQLQQEPAAQCEFVWREFGPSGRTVPGIVYRR